MNLKRLLFFICAVALLSACVSNKQADVTPQGDISATIDGVTKTFTLNTKSSFISNSVVLIVGNNRADQDSVTIEITKLDATLDAGTYLSDSLGRDKARGAHMLYVDYRDSTKYANTGTYYTVDNMPNGIDYKGSIVVTAINDSLLTGTFGGTFVLGAKVIAGAPGVTKSVANGTFSIKVKNVPLIQ